MLDRFDAAMRLIVRGTLTLIAAFLIGVSAVVAAGLVVWWLGYLAAQVSVLLS